MIKSYSMICIESYWCSVLSFILASISSFKLVEMQAAKSLVAYHNWLL